jgi:hypothetical protein
LSPVTLRLSHHRSSPPFLSFHLPHAERDE